MYDTLSTTIRQYDDCYGQMGQNLRHLANEQMGERSSRACQFAGAGACGTGAEESK